MILTILSWWISDFWVLPSTLFTSTISQKHKHQLAYAGFPVMPVNLPPLLFGSPTVSWWRRREPSAIGNTCVQRDGAVRARLSKRIMRAGWIYYFAGDMTIYSIATRRHDFWLKILKNPHACLIVCLISIERMMKFNCLMARKPRWDAGSVFISS